MQHELGGLDPASSGDVEAIRAVLRTRRQSFGPEFRAFARRVHEESPDPSLRIDALNTLASAAVVAGDDDEGSRLFRRALDATWDSGTHAERVACVNLSMILARQRRLLEALAMSRRACRIALADTEPLAICLSHVQLGKMLLELGDLDGFRRAVEVAELHRPELDETLSGWIPHLLAGMHAEVALQEGDIASADRFMNEALEGADVIGEVVAMARATHLRRAGRHAESLEVVRTALADEGLDPGFRLRFEAEELLCLVDSGDVASLRRKAAACLGGMAADGRKCGTPTWRMRVGETVGHALSNDEATRGEARRALEIAAVAALERSWETRQFFREFPALERLEPADAALLDAHAERFRARHLELLAAMRALLSEGARHETPLADDAGAAFFVSVCAWCNRVRGPERVWIPLEEFVAPTSGLEVTHGLCQACRTSVVAESRTTAGIATHATEAAGAASSAHR